MSEGCEKNRKYYEYYHLPSFRLIRLVGPKATADGLGLKRSLARTSCMYICMYVCLVLHASCALIYYYE